MSSDKRTSRRQFFSLKSAARALQDVPLEKPESAEILMPGDMSQMRAESYVVHVTAKAMACTFEVILNAGIEAEFAEPAIDVFDLIHRLENQMTVYREDSEISRLNRLASQEPITVERRLFELLQKAHRIYELTDGAFDMTAGPLSKAWGFYRRERRIPAASELSELLQKVGSHKVQFDPELSQVSFAQSGIEINLGGIGKGYALDRCSEELKSCGLENYMMHGGASSILASGERSGIQKQGKRGWVVGIRHPVWPEKYLAEVYLQNQALGTSGTARQSFVHEGKKYGHIIDPKTGMPCDGILSSTVIAPSAAESDALATAFYVMGPEKTVEFCQSHPEIKAILVVTGEKPGTTGVYALNLESDDWKLLSE